MRVGISVNIPLASTSRLQKLSPSPSSRWDCAPNEDREGLVFRLPAERRRPSDPKDDRPWQRADTLRTLTFSNVTSPVSQLKPCTFKTDSPKNPYAAANFVDYHGPPPTDNHVLFPAGTVCELIFGTTNGAPLWGAWDLPRVADVFRRLVSVHPAGGLPDNPCLRTTFDFPRLEAHLHACATTSTFGVQ